MTRLLKSLLPLLMPLLMIVVSGNAFAQEVPKLSAVLGQSDEQEFLHPDDAFHFSADFTDANTVLVRMVIADGYYLYQQQFKFDIAGDANGVTVGGFVFPEGTLHSDEYFGEQIVYYQQVEIPVVVSGPAGTEFAFRVRYQGCADAGLCYPPIFKTVALTLPADASASAPISNGVSSSNINLSEQDALAQMIISAEIGWVMLAFIGFGLLLTFTPCVLPMVPILSSIIVGQKDITPSKAFVLSLVYVLAMALTYTAAGVIAGLFGANLQAAFQDPVVLSVFAAVFVLLAFSMFGFYDLQIPASWQSKLTQVSGNQQGGTLLGVAVMGLLSALIVGPCVAAPLAGALIVIGQTGDPVRGGIALFSLSIGMGLPLLAVGTGFGKFVPKAGGWMNTVKAVFGVMLLAVAIYLLERILPDFVAVALWGALAIGSAIYMGAFEPAPTGARKFARALGLLLFIWGTMIFIGLASGRADIFHPLKGLSGGGVTSVSEEHLPFKRIKSVADLEREVATARSMNKPVMLDFYADWCISCKEMERYTFTDPAVRQALGDFVLLQADVTVNDETDQALLKAFGLYGPPGIIFYDRSGTERRELRVVGFKNAADFAAIVARAGAVE